MTLVRSAFGVALGLLVSLVPLIDLCRCDFGCRLRGAKGRREWSYHIMVGPYLGVIDQLWERGRELERG